MWGKMHDFSRFFMKIWPKIPANPGKSCKIRASGPAGSLSAQEAKNPGLHGFIRAIWQAYLIRRFEKY